MLKHVYRAILLVAVFIGSLYYFGRNIREVIFHMDDTTIMSEANFPLITLGVGDETVNLLHGYLSTMDANSIRDAITPLDDTQNFFIYIDEKESTVKKVNYELRNTFDNSLIESGSYSALEKLEDKKVAKIKINEKLDEHTEYVLKVTCVTAESKKINYYTRIVKSKSYPVKEQLAFVMNFHDKILDKKKVDEVADYLEFSKTEENTNLAHVTIFSNKDLLSFGNLNPKVITEVIPTIKEVSSDIASIQLSYYIEGKTGDGSEIYQVKEFYRVKYTPSRMYLLNYERTMEALFDMNHMSLAKGEFKIGIANNTEIPMYVGEGNQNLCFIRERELWYYNIQENKAARVFSFKEDKSDYIRDVYDQHEIKVLNMNVEGNIDFIVYGYMNRGTYEGRVGILLYRYYPNDQRIEELVYIPANVPYQVLKEGIGGFSYVNYNDVYYFLLNETIYSYNIITKSLQELAVGISEEDYVFSKDKGFLAWQMRDEDGLARTITILQLETNEIKTLQAGDKENIRILGLIENDIIYGVCRDQDTYTTIDGEKVIPLYQLYIIENNGTVLKNYAKKNYYVTDAYVKDNVIELVRIKKETDGFRATKNDFILNRVINRDEVIKVTTRVTEQAMTEYYLSFVKETKLTGMPAIAKTVNTVITEETALRLDTHSSEEYYYVYAYGGIQGRYQSAGEAIVVADAMVGTVVNQNQQIVWQRGTRSSKVDLTIGTPVYVSENVTSYDACAKMLKHSRKKYKTQVSEVYQTQAMKELATEIGATIVNVTGCELSQALYYLHMGRPVMAAKDTNRMVLITGYDSTSITVIDPSSKTQTKMSLKNAKEMFEKAGNVYLSYID